MGALVVVGFRCLAVVCGFPSVGFRAWCLGLWLDCLRWVTSMDFRVDVVTSLRLVLLTWVGWVRMVGSLCGLLFWFSGVWDCSGGFTLWCWSGLLGFRGLYNMWFWFGLWGF